jgi:hypothetical protein
MNLTSIFLILISCAGVTWTFVQSTIMDKIGLRPLWEKSQFLKELWNCGFCGGFHVGYSYGLFLYYLNTLGSFWFYVLTIPFCSACMGFLFERLLFLMIEIIGLVEKWTREK